MPTTTTTNDETRARRRQMTQILGIDISNARCQSHMKNSLIPPELREELDSLQEELKTACEEDEDDIASAKERISALTENLVRIGSDAPIAMAAICDYTTKAVIRHAMDQTLAAERKVVDVAAIHQATDNLDVWALIGRLPVIRSYDPATEEELRKERAAANKAAKAAREAAKAAREAGEAGEADEADAAAAPAATRGSTTFNTYVDNATRTVKSDEQYATMRVSNRLREVVATLIAELVSGLTRMAKIAVQDLLHVRTLTAGHLTTQVQMVLTFQGGDFSALEEYVSEKIATYRAHLESERVRKWSEMSDEKRAEIEKQRADVAETRLRNRIKNAKTRAKNSATLAKKLTKDLKK
jgi:hypothetical protein